MVTVFTEGIYTLVTFFENRTRANKFRSKTLAAPSEIMLKVILHMIFVQ